MAKFQFSPELVARRAERDRRNRRRPDATISCANGNCAMEYGICGACYEDTHRELSAWAAEQPDPWPGEDACRYWRRIDGPFYDAWHTVAIARMGTTATTTA